MQNVQLDYSDLIGIPYGFREAGNAYDCFTIIAEIFHRLGWNYSIPVQIREQIANGSIRIHDIDQDVWKSIPHCSQLGDVALIRGAGGATAGEAAHCAVLVAPGLMLHATSKLGVHTVRWKSVRPFIVKCIRYDRSLLQ